MQRAVGLSDEVRVARVVAAPQVVQDRQHDRQDDPLLDTDQHDDGRRRAGHEELVHPPPHDPSHPRAVDQLDADQEHDRGEHCLREVLQGLRQEQQHDQDDERRHQLRELAPPAGTVHHLRLRRAPVHDERPR